MSGAQRSLAPRGGGISPTFARSSARRSSSAGSPTRFLSKNCKACVETNCKACVETGHGSGEYGPRVSGNDHQSSFSANCTCRAVVEVAVIAPAVPDTPEGVKVIRFGVLKLARFSRLKISARNCRVRRSRRVRVLDGREVPRCQTGAGEVVAGGVAPETAVRWRLQKHRRIEPLRRRPENCVSCEARIVERPHRVAGVAVVRRVIAELRGEGKSALQGDNAVLRTSRSPARYPSR